MIAFRPSPGVPPEWQREECLINHGQTGFTLVELMVALSVAAILLMLSVGFAELVADNRRTAAINEFVAALHYARLEAVTRAARVTICRSANQNSCGDGAGWETGWIVFTDPANPGVVDRDEQILKVHEALAAMTLRGNSHIADRVSYTPMGTSLGFNGTFTLCDARGFQANGKYHARQILLGTGGRARTKVPTAGGSCT